MLPQEVQEKQLVLFALLYRKEWHVRRWKKRSYTMLFARAYGYEKNSIGGFDREHLVESLGLDSKRYLPVMIVSFRQAAESEFESILLTC